MVPLLCLAGDQWPQLRGPEGAGIAEGSAPVEFGLKQGRIWSAELPAGHSSPSVWGAHIFLTGFEAKEKSLIVLDVDRGTGKIRWQRTVKASAIEEVHPVSSPATATAIADGERVYVYFGSAGLFAFDFEGNPAWNVPLPVVKTSYGSGTSPALMGDAVVLARDNPGDRYLAAYDRKTGREMWKAPLGGPEGAPGGNGGHGMPVAWRDQILLHRPGEIAGYDRRNGERKWAIAITSEGTGTPVISGDTVYFAAWLGADDLMDPMPSWDVMLQKYDKNHDGLISKDEFPDDLAISRRVDAANVPGAIVTIRGLFERMVDRDHDGQVSEAEWNAFLVQLKTMLAKPRGLMAIRLDSESKKIEWIETRAVPEVPMPLVYRDRVYAVTNGGIVTALGRRSGKVIYRARLGAGGVYYSSPVEAGGKIYFASGDGVVCVADGSEDALNVIARNDLGESIFATPAIVDGRIYVRTTGHLYAFGK